MSHFSPSRYIVSLQLSLSYLLVFWLTSLARVLFLSLSLSLSLSLPLSLAFSLSLSLSLSLPPHSFFPLAPLARWLAYSLALSLSFSLSLAPSLAWGEGHRVRKTQRISSGTFWGVVAPYICMCLYISLVSPSRCLFTSLPSLSVFSVASLGRFSLSLLRSLSRSLALSLALSLSLSLSLSLALAHYL